MADDAPRGTPDGPSGPAIGSPGGDDPIVASTPIQQLRSTATGAVLAAGLLGLRDALEGPAEEEVAVVNEWGGEPARPDDPILMRLDPDHPEDSIVLVRPWLLRADEA